MLSLHEQLARFPRLSLAEYPTPLEPLNSLSKEFGQPLFIKRDDLIGPGLGGNKTRKLEYLLCDAQRRGARKVVTFGGLQSNHARLTAAAAIRLGMQPHLLYFDQKPGQLRGNLLLNEILGARLHFIPFGGGNSMSLEDTIRLVHLVAWALVGPHYYIPVGGHNWLGGLGYVEAAFELHEQACALGIENARVIVPAGSGGTLAGLMAGLALANSNLRLLGIDVGRLWKGFSASIARLAEDICNHAGQPHLFKPGSVPIIENAYVGEMYGTPSKEGLNAIRWLARKEGVLLDPVYTGKAFAGLIDLLEKKRLGDNEPVIFIHTGGVPALFAFSDLDF